jgi:outer membrane protein OmpA-like peptidoglycan-associated protein
MLLIASQFITPVANSPQEGLYTLHTPVINQPRGYLSMQRILLTAATLAVLVYALVLGVKWLSPRIENDLANRITTELAQSGQLWAGAQVKGREVTLVGEAPSTEAQEAVRSALAKVYGMARITDLTTLPGQIVSNGLVVSATQIEVLKPLSRAERKAMQAAEGAYTLTIGKQGNALKLEGNVPDEDAKALLLQLAALHFPEAQLDATNLAVKAEGAPAGWRSAAGTVLFNLTNLETAEATLTGREIAIKGTVLAADFAESAESKIRAAVPSLYQVAFAVETKAPEVMAETPVVTEEKLETPAAVAEVKAVDAAPVVAKTIDILAVKTEKAVDSALAAIEPAAGAYCASVATATKAVLHFGFNKAAVRKADMPKVKAVASAVKGCANAKVTVKGYTDETGSKAYNQWLSEQRAENTLRALLRQGVAREALTAKGYGETKQFSRKHKAPNRRVVFDAK